MSAIQLGVKLEILAYFDVDSQQLPGGTSQGSSMVSR